MADAYIQCPNMVIFGLPDLSSSERIVLIALIGLVWGDEKPHPISIRALAKLIHISAAALCDSAKNEEEKQRQQEQGKYREGILTRLAGYGYITVEYLTNERGKHNQVVITVHLTKIWEDNTAFKKEHGVYKLNTLNGKGVQKLNTSVYKLNTQEGASVYKLNGSVSNLNTHVSQNGSTKGVEALPKNKEESIEEDNKKVPSFSQNKMGAIRIAMRECLRLFGNEHDQEYRERAHALLVQSGLAVVDFRARVDSAVNETKLAGGDIEYFFKCLERVCANTM